MGRLGRVKGTRELASGERHAICDRLPCRDRRRGDPATATWRAEMAKQALSMNQLGVTVFLTLCHFPNYLAHFFLAIWRAEVWLWGPGECRDWPGLTIAETLVCATGSDPLDLLGLSVAKRYCVTFGNMATGLRNGRHVSAWVWTCRLAAYAK